MTASAWWRAWAAAWGVSWGALDARSIPPARRIVSVGRPPNLSRTVR